MTPTRSAAIRPGSKLTPTEFEYAPEALRPGGLVRWAVV